MHNAKGTRALTIKYWLSLPQDSKKRALQHCFPTLDVTVDLLLKEKPKNIKRGLWSIVFSDIREVLPDERGIRSYRTCYMNRVWIP